MLILRYSVSMLKDVLIVLAMTAGLAACRPANEEHAPYMVLNCSEYVAAVNHHSVIKAADFFAGRAPGYKLIETTVNVEGDVAAFHGSHVAVFHNGEWRDSDPAHDGVGPMHYDASDLWFRGQVRLFRRTH